MEYEVRRKEHPLRCYNQAWMNSGGMNPWNAIAICEMSKTSWRMGKLLVKDDSENHSKAWSYLSLHWLNIIRLLQEASPSSTNLARKFYLENSLDMRWTRRNLARKYSGRRHWRFGKDGRVRNLSSKNQCKRSIDATSEWIFHLSKRRWYSKIVRKRPRISRIHSKAGTNREKWRYLWRTSRRTGRVSTDRIQRWRWSPEWLLVNPKWLHLSSSQWTSSSTLCAERKNIPYSTAVHWCAKDYEHKSGCDAKTNRHYWNVVANRSFTDSWTGFTKFTLL